MTEVGEIAVAGDVPEARRDLREAEPVVLREAAHDPAARAFMAKEPWERGRLAGVWRLEARPPCAFLDRSKEPAVVRAAEPLDTIQNDARRLVDGRRRHEERLAVHAHDVRARQELAEPLERIAEGHAGLDDFCARAAKPEDREHEADRGDEGPEAEPRQRGTEEPEERAHVKTP
jgi:hypothetical protein